MKHYNLARLCHIMNPRSRRVLNSSKFQEADGHSCHTWLVKAAVKRCSESTRGSGCFTISDLKVFKIPTLRTKRNGAEKRTFERKKGTWLFTDISER